MMQAVSSSSLARTWRRLQIRGWDRAFDLLSPHRRFRQAAMRKLFAEHCHASALGYVEFDDHVFFVDPRDDKIAFRLLRGRPWQRDILEAAIARLVAARVLRRGGWFIDVGANIGTHTVYALRSGEFARAVAVEAEPQNFKLLERNIIANSLHAEVIAVRAAASYATGEARLSLNLRNFGAHALLAAKAQSTADTVAVRARPLDAILAAERIEATDVGLVWIDVEGHELGVLHGMTKLRAASVPIVFEYGPAADAAGGLAAFKDLLGKNYTHAVDLAAVVQDESTHGRAVALMDLQPATTATDILVYRA